MDNFGSKRLGDYWRQVDRWFSRTADRALDEAYKAALKIKALEDEHFNGGKIVIPEEYANNQVAAYFQNDLNKYLNIARIRLAEFQTSRTITGNSSPSIDSSNIANRGVNSINPYTADIESQARVLEKLAFIDEVLARYLDRDTSGDFLDRAIDKLIPPVSLAPNPPPVDRLAVVNNNNKDRKIDRVESSSSAASVLDPSLIKTFRQIKQDLDPQTDDGEVLQNYRENQTKTRIALRYVLLLILVPLLVQFSTKIAIVGPVVNFYRTNTQADVFLNIDFQNEAIEELERFEKKIKFSQMVGIAPKLSNEEVEEQVKAKASEIKERYYRHSSSAIENWFADLFAALSFYLLLITGKQQIAILKAFIDNLIVGLSDTAKAFIIILVTDVFVGFHSPHGWEVILAGIANHLGIPENREFNSLFIATIPVMMDTLFKYWIFRYLNGQSPSAVATYKTMNE